MHRIKSVLVNFSCELRRMTNRSSGCVKSSMVARAAPRGLPVSSR